MNREIVKLVIGGDRRKNPERKKFRTMGREEVLALKCGDRPWFLALDGKARTLKINGAVRTWKRDPNRVEVPIKYGMHEYGTFSLEEAMARLLVEVTEG